MSNSLYGQFPYESSLLFSKDYSSLEICMKLRLQGYFSAKTALLEDKIYFISGRLIA
jgi:hypothetical protein